MGVRILMSGGGVGRAQVHEEEDIGPNGGREWHQISIRLTKRQWRALNRMGSETGNAPAATVRELIVKHLQHHGFLPKDS